MAAAMAGQPVETLAQAFHCSTTIAGKTHREYLEFFTGDTAPALLAYYGQAYKCLHADALSLADWQYAQQHVFMVSFLYGLLRPLDAIHAYRMEGNVRPWADRDDMPFNYWKDRLTSLLIDAVNRDGGILMHLATKEFERLFHWQRVTQQLRVVQPLFYVDEGTRFRTVSMYAKSCRGAMTRYIVENKVDDPALLADFTFDGFRFDPHLGDDDHPHYILQQNAK